MLSTFNQKIRLFSTGESLSEMLSYSDFDLRDIGNGKTAVFMIIHDEKKTYHGLMTIFIKQCYETLIDVAQQCGGKLPYRTNFILDEFANMPPLKDVTTMVTAARSRHIKFYFIIQNFAQLTQVYGKENGDTIKGNCGNIIYLISSEIAALEEISKMCGEVKSKEKDKTASTPLVTVSDLQRLPEGNIIVLRTRMMPFKTKMVYNWKMDWGKKYPLAGYPERERKEVQLFDIKEVVNKIREEKMNNLMNGLGENTPPFPGLFGGGQPNKSESSFNVEDLVSKIDARIAELEEEERREKEAEEAKNKEKTEESNNIEEDNNKETETKEEKYITNNDVTDDQFFDDFFDDEE